MSFLPRSQPYRGGEGAHGGANCRALQQPGKVLRRGALRVAGVDGCPGGWFVVLWDGKEDWQCVLCPTFASVIRSTSSCTIVGVDIPMGLLREGQKGGRECDRCARRLLGRVRGSSVFSPPSRKALSAKDVLQARMLNAPAGLTKQAFHLLPKIKEVDEVMTPRLQERIKEVHPEASFFVANSCQPLELSKRKPKGREVREACLKRVLGEGWRNWYLKIQNQFPRRTLELHDVLDASIAVWTAKRIACGEAIRIPPEPPRDERGLSMEIWA